MSGHQHVDRPRTEPGALTPTPWAALSSPGSSWMGSDAGTEARQPHDWQAAWPIRAGPKLTNHLREEKVLRTRAWGGWLPGLWAKTRNTSLSALRADMSLHSHREQRLNILHPSRRWARAQRGLGHTQVAPRWGMASTLGSPPPPPSPKETPKLNPRAQGYIPAPPAQAEGSESQCPHP